MKTRKRNDRSLHRLRANNRWKWTAGASAATAAGVTASQGSAITINLGSYISATDGNHLDSDLTGDGHPDITIANTFASVHPGFSSYQTAFRVGVDINGVRAYAFLYTFNRSGFARLGSRSAFYPSSAAAYLMGAIPIFFKDLHINGGKPTAGSLEVTVSAGHRLDGIPTVQLDSFSYSSNTPVAGARVAVREQGSSLALLAMGAGGVLALRRWRAAQEGS